MSRAATEPTGPTDPAAGGLIEERDFLLRSLRDLEAEHTAGDIGEADYLALKEDYTRRAAAVLRRLVPAAAGGEAVPGAAGVEPDGAAPDGTGSGGAATAGDPAGTAGDGVGAAEAGGGPASPAGGAPSRRRVGLRRAVIAAGVLLCIIGAGWVAAAESGVRLPGQSVSGDAVGPAKTDEELIQAAQAVTAGHLVQGMRDYQNVLDTQPDNPSALTGYGAILVASDQSALVARGAVMLAKAESADPSYAPAYAYLGRALVLMDDYGSAEKQLRTFLRAQKSGALAREARQLLTYDETQLAKAARKPAAPASGSSGAAG